MSTEVAPILTVGFQTPTTETLASEKEYQKKKEKEDQSKQDLVANKNSIITPHSTTVEKPDRKESINGGDGDNQKNETHSDVNTEISQNLTTGDELEGDIELFKKRTVADFKFGRELGSGSFAVVKIATEISTSISFAVKILEKQQIIKERKTKYVNTEKTILNMIKHPNVVQLFYTFQDEKNLYFVLELCPNGELYDHLKKAGRFSEEVAKFYMAEIILAVEFIHSLGVVHRDLKPENILLDPHMHVKLNDFGTAKIIGNEKHARSNSFTGTAEYVSPEMLNDKSAGKSADLWSLGIILYQMLAGRPPFRGGSAYETFQLIQKRNILWPSIFSKEAHDLIEKLLDPNPLTRIGAEEFSDLKNHPFFKGIDWATLNSQKPPTIVTDVSFDYSNELKRVQSTPNINALSTSPKGKHRVTSASMDDRRRLLQQQKTSIWSRFLFQDELIIHTGLIWKKKGLFSKKRQLILTDRPRLFYVDPDQMEIKGEIPWSRTLLVDVKSNRKFNIIVPNRTYLLEDIANIATRWQDAIKKLQQKE